MYVECLAITILIFAMSVIFMRAGKKTSAFAILPLVLVPIANVLGNLISKPISGLISIDRTNVHIFIDILALIIAGIFFGNNSNKFKNRKNRLTYLFICGFFTMVLTFVLILEILK